MIALESRQVKIVAVQPADLAEIVLEAPPRRPGGRKWLPLPLFDRQADVPAPAPPNAPSYPSRRV